MEITASCLVLLAWLFFLDRDNMLFYGLVACFLHEMGHYVTILAFGGKVNWVRLTVVGAEMDMPTYFSYEKEWICALAGPLSNIFLALILTKLDINPFFAGINITLAMVNLLPLGTLDGGRGLSAILKEVLSLTTVEKLQRVIDFVCSFLVLVVGFLIFLEGGTITLFVLGLWLTYHTLAV